MRLLVLALLLGSALAGAQAPATTYAFPERLRPDARATLTNIADSARAAGLPTDPLVAKAAEGVLKGAADARIVFAVRALARHLAQARDALGASVTDATLAAAADALRAGISTESLRDLGVANAGRAEADLGLALITVTDLAASGVPVRNAERAVTALLRRGAPERDLPALRAAIAHDIAAGVAPETALDARLETLVRTREGGAARIP